MTPPDRARGAGGGAADPERRAPGAGLAAGPLPRRRALGAARRPAARRRGRRVVGAAPARREGRRARRDPRRAAVGVLPAGPGARGADDRHGVPRAGAARTPTRPCPRTPAGTRSPRCRRPRSTTRRSSARAQERLRAKLSYTNIGFAMVPREFTISALRELYSAALGHPVSATNLQRVLTRRALLEPTGRGRAARAGRWPAGGAVPVRRPVAAGHRRVRGAPAARRVRARRRTVAAWPRPCRCSRWGRF